MELRPWVISVLSTSYDLKECREFVISQLKSKGVTVSAFEEPDFPVESKMHSHDSCLVALSRADIAILIINKRSGGAYYNREDKKVYESITAKEFSTAIKEQKPIFTFVVEKAWDERHIYKEQLKKYRDSLSTHKMSRRNNKKAKRDFDEKYKCSYVENVSTIDFIDQIQYAYESNKVSNWIDTFTAKEDLLEKIVGKLKGYSRKLVERIVKSQSDTLQNKHTSTAFGMTLGDVFKHGYYIDPPYNIETGFLNSQHSEFPLKILDTVCSDKSVLMYGEAGYGKTTILAKCFSEHVNQYISNPSYDVPFFVSLRNKGSDYHFDVERLISDELASTENSALRHGPYPYLDLSQIRFKFYCDGFDELAEKLSANDLERIHTSSIFSFPMLLTCRQQFANRYLKNLSFSDKFGVRILVDRWNIDMVQKYVNNFCDINSDIKDEKRNIISRTISDDYNLQQILDSPLLISMFLWYAKQSKASLSDITGTELFKKWIHDLAIREHSKNGADPDDIVDFWTYSAWEVYLHKMNGKSSILRFDDLFCSLVKHFPSTNLHLNPSLFSTLFDCNNDGIVGTFHEQFMEYLVAKILVEACIDQKEPYPSFLKMVIRPEINRYFREIWSACNNNEKERSFNALYTKYMENVGNDSPEAVFTRVHAIYHMARLDFSLRFESIEKAFKIENNISVLLSLYFGAIKMGKLDKEEEFYNLLLSEDKYNSANRGYHLVYYSDSISDDNWPFEDNATCNWSGTLKAFERHYKSTERGHYLLRRIDLVTMIQLIEARQKVAPLTEELLAVFKEQIDNPPYSHQPQDIDFNNKVNIEYQRLVLLYKSLL